MGASRPGTPNTAAAPAAESARDPGTSTHRHRYDQSGIAEKNGCARGSPLEPHPVAGVRSSDCSAGKSVNTTSHVITSPAATQRPNSKMGLIRETASAANPTAAAKSDAVQGTNLFA